MAGNVQKALAAIFFLTKISISLNSQISQTVEVFLMTKMSRTIEIDLEIYRLIATNRLSFDETDTDIIRRLLGLKPSVKQTGDERGMNLGYGVILPNGTLLKGEYKRAEYQAQIKDDRILFNGVQYDTVSAAAKKFGGPNGWKFWEWVKRPQDSEWILLDQLRNRETIIRKRRLSDEELSEFD
jgi:hypothetical protein